MTITSSSGLSIVIPDVVSYEDISVYAKPVRDLGRAFLHDAPLMLLDEPTSNLDSLNEGVILQTLRDEQANRTIILVPHRKTTLSIAHRAYTIDSGRLS